MSNRVSINIEMPAVHINLPYFIGIVSIEGDSGTGKSYICDMIKEAKCSKYNGVKADFPLRDIIIWDNVESVHLGVNAQYSNKYIIIDRYQLLVRQVPDIIEFVNRNSSNCIVLISHGEIKDVEIMARRVYKVVSSIDKDTNITKLSYSHLL